MILNNMKNINKSTIVCIKKRLHYCFHSLSSQLSQEKRELQQKKNNKKKYILSFDSWTNLLPAAKRLLLLAFSTYNFLRSYDLQMLPSSLNIILHNIYPF